MEDDRALAKVIYEELKAAGFNVTYAADGETGLKAIKSKKPNLVFLI
ncbi:MAG: hypothetical protein ABH887_02470 [bacterium]